ncbi:ankyrin repeat-containing protein [Gossypium australe]|uniref:Ankyrin repeat-containing protein n=1 Tax=Gossypium australe TaxID=47621 RepID=A0A5B6WER3_9ROSI|nr:ankyrin repeat-containing protein [Gossypium australe]
MVYLRKILVCLPWLTGCIIIPSQQPQPPVEAITFMDCDLLKATEDGDMEFFNKYHGDLHCLLDGRRSTALYIYSINRRMQTSSCVTGTGSGNPKESSPFISRNNWWTSAHHCCFNPMIKGEIPLHIAARHGHYKIVKFLIERALENSEASGSWWRTMLRMKDKADNTAFHMAVECPPDDIDVVRLLVKELELDPEFSLSANKSGETPLYIVAMTSYDYGGPEGTTTLHAAIGGEDNKNKKGRTPFHYAAHFGNYSAAEQLLEMDASATYVWDKERKMTALYMAAWVGNANIMQFIISHCPASCEIVDERGWNFVHYAAGSDVHRSTIQNLLYEKDVNGNTPLDVFSMFLHSGPSAASSNVLTSLELKGFEKSMADSDANYENKKKQKREILKEIGNNAGVEGIRPHKSFRENMGKENNPSTLKEVVDKLRETHLLVAALVATVAFTAAIAVPGGYKTDDKGTVDEGPAILSHNSAFKTFVMTNAMPFVSSLLAIFLHFLSVFITMA